METARIRSTSIDDTFDISERGGDTSERGGGNMDVFDISDRSSNNTDSPAFRKKNRRSIIRQSLKRKRKVKNPNNTIEPARVAYDKIEIIESFLRDEIEMSNEMTKSGFRKLLLDHGGIHVDDTLLDAIFIQTDEDGNGLLDPHEFASYIHDIKPSTKSQRRKYIISSCLKYPPFYLSFFCLNASLMSASTNLREREYGDLYGNQSHHYWVIAACSDLIGLCGYVILKWEEERLKYENLQQARIRLVQWVNVDLPRFVNKTTTRKLKKSSTISKSDSTLEEVTSAPDGAKHDLERGDLERGEGTRNVRVSFVDEVITDGNEKDQSTNTTESIEHMPSSIQEDSHKEDNTLVGVLKSTEQFMYDTGDAIKSTGDKITQQLKTTGDKVLEGGEQLVIMTEEVLKATGDIVTEGYKTLTANIGKASEFDPEESIKSIRALLFQQKGDSEDQMPKDGLDIQELRLLLETVGVFLGQNALREIFYEIDADQSGCITVNELLQYATKNEKLIVSKYNNYFKYLAILKRCFLTIGWWSSWSYVVGAISWVCLSTVPNASVLELQMFLGFTVILYLVGALGNLSNLYRATQIQFFHIDNARMMLREAAISIGLSQTEQADVSSSQMEQINNIQGQIKDKMESKLLPQQNEQLDTSDRTAQRRETILAVRATMKTMSSSISNTSGDSKSRSYMKKLSSNISSKSLLTAQEVGAEFLFRIIDVSDDDNTIDEKELFDALVTLGVMIPSDAFEYLFRDMDESKDGKLQLDEFCKYVSNIKPGLSKRRRRMTTLKYMVKQVSFYLVLCQVFAGSAQTHAAWIGLSTINATRNLFLAGSFAWAIGSLYFVFTWPKNKGSFFNQLETARFNIKAAILDGCEAHYKLPRTASNKSEWSTFNKERRKLNEMPREDSCTSTCSADNPTPNQESDTAYQDPESLSLSDKYERQWDNFFSSQEIADQINDG